MMPYNNNTAAYITVQLYSFGAGNTIENLFEYIIRVNYKCYFTEEYVCDFFAIYCWTKKSLRKLADPMRQLKYTFISHPGTKGIC